MRATIRNLIEFTPGSVRSRICFPRPEIHSATHLNNSTILRKPQFVFPTKDSRNPPNMWPNISHVQSTFSKKLNEYSAQQRLFAVFYCGNMQYKASPGDVIITQRLNGVSTNPFLTVFPPPSDEKIKEDGYVPDAVYHARAHNEIVFKKVMMVGGPTFTAIGRPFLSNVTVLAVVEEHKHMKSAIHWMPHKKMHRLTMLDSRHKASVVRILDVRYEPNILFELDK